MAKRKSIGIRDRLNSLISRTRIKDLAEESGAFQRFRKVDPVILFWTLVLGFGTGKDRTFAGLRRAYELAARTTIAPSAFWDRFTPGLVRFLKAACSEIMSSLCPPTRSLRGALSGFKDLVVADCTVIRLHDLLSRAYAGCRTNHSKAAAKLHVVMSVVGMGPRTVRITSERADERDNISIGSWVKDRLLLVDLGYYSFQLFSRIDRNGGYFISRLKSNGNPRIVRLLRKCRGRSVDLVGRRLQEVLPLLLREVIDCEVEVAFKRRVYTGRSRRDTAIFRMVGELDPESGEYHLYLTNIPAIKLEAEEVAITYRARWFVELLFMELKSGYRLAEMPTSNRAATEALIYAALATMMASRRLLEVVRLRLKELAHRIPAGRWSRVFRAYAPQIMMLVAMPPRFGRLLAGGVETALLHEAVDPHLGRPGLVDQVERRIRVAA